MSHGLNTTYKGAEEIIGFGISAETAFALGLVDFSTRQIIFSKPNPPQKKSSAIAAARVRLATAK